jgi:FdhE protein
MSRLKSGARMPPRDVLELQALAKRKPELAQAALLHAELVSTVRRVESRVATSALDVAPDLLAARLARGVPLAAFGEFPVDWNDVRLLIRQITDVLRRSDLIDAAAAARLHAVGRDPALADRTRAWYEAQGVEGASDEPDPMWPEILQWALRPFLIRTAEVLTRRVAIGDWQRGRCPVCGAEPEFAEVGSQADRHLLCPRCHARWPFQRACPFCGNQAAGRLRTLATHDRVYRVMDCLDCGRYLKALDSQAAGRPLLPFYDPVATLPLDAVMMKEGT